MTDAKTTRSYKLRIWRQPDATSPGRLVDYEIADVDPDSEAEPQLLNELGLGEGLE